MWFAMAGLILSGKVNKAEIVDAGEQKIAWGIGEYLNDRIVNYVVKNNIATVTIVFVLQMERGGCPKTMHG